MPDSFTRGDGFAVCYFFAALLNTEKTESRHSFDFYFDPLFAEIGTVLSNIKRAGGFSKQKRTSSVKFGYRQGNEKRCTFEIIPHSIEF